jgi:hypothetical protein
LGFVFCAELGVTPPAIKKLKTASAPSISLLKPFREFIFSSPLEIVERLRTFTLVLADTTTTRKKTFRR